MYIYVKYFLLKTLSETALAFSETALAVSETALAFSETALAFSETALAVSVRVNYFEIELEQTSV
jgi:hypothetical protein